MGAIQIRKVLIFSIRTCYRSVRRHPFLVGMVFFLIFLYRLFPFMFSLLVSTSPVLVSTAVLLGTLLSYGKPNIPEIEKEEKTTHEIVRLKTGGPRDAIVVERDGSYNVERFTEHRRDVVEKSIEEASTTANDFSEVDKDDTLAESALLVEEKSREFQFDKQETEEGERELPDMVIEKNNDLNELKQGDGKLLENQYSSIQQFDEKSLDESENDKSPEGDVGSETVDRNSPPGSPWKQEDEREEEDDDVSDSGSDGAESSSPDASMADIIPLLDELHPLLDEHAPQLAHLSHEGSDATSEHSSKSFSDGSNELDEDIENREEALEVGDDEEGEETRVDKEDEAKSAIRWTEDDQKNLMDLGTSELERNQRLENLIARRRLRKSMKIMTEKNLIDFDGFDFPFNVAPISTARHNPFDLPYDDMGLPPIPGSAPSIMVPRRNPFDLPYDSSEEKPDLMGDDFQQDVEAHQPKEQFFRRNETFNVGPSLFGTPRHDYKFRPYFVPERMTSEGTSYSSLRRQSSELSDSKASSAPETESIGSAEDLEDKKAVEEDFSQQPELISMSEHPSEHVGHRSESCEDEDSFELGQVEKRDDAVNEIEVKLGDVEDDKEVVSSLSETAVLATPMEVNANQIHLNTEVLQAEYSSSSSSSEVDEKIFSEKEGECFSEPLRDNLIENPAISYQPYAEKSDIDITSQLVDDTQHKEPVYDSSPTALEKKLSSSSICSDLQVEIAETSSPPVLVERTTSITERDSEVSNQSIEKNTPAIEADEKLIAANYQSLSEELLLSRLEKEMLSPDQSVDERYPESPKKLQDSTNYLNVLVLQEIDNRVQPNINSPETSEATSKQSEDIETKATPGLADSEDNILDIGENGEHILVLEHHKFPGEATDTDCRDDTQNNIEDINDIKEFDEGLLLELDTVGDFSVKNLGSNLNESGGESFHMWHDVGNSSGDVEGDSVVAHETRVTMNDRENLRTSMVEEEISKFEGEMEGDSESQMSGTSSIENVDSSIKEIVRREVEDPIDYELIDDEPLAEKTAPEPADSKIVQNPNTEEINSDMSVVEVRAIKDIEPSYKEAEPMDVGFGESEIPHEGLISAGTEVGMPVLEAQSLEDIKSAFSQINEREIEKPFVIESVHAELSPYETVAGRSEREILHEGSVLAENKSDLTRSIQDGHLEQQNEGIVESPILLSSNGDDPDNTESQNAAGTPSEVHVRKARSNDDTNVALVQVSEGNLEKLPKSDYEKESAENEVNEVRSGKAIEPSSEISVVLETSSGTAEKGSNEVETSEDLRISGVELKREDSHRSSSSSSSSSSDSDIE